MKKAIFTIFILFLAFSYQSFAQTTTDFFAGKWDISVFGSPRGDVNIKATLIRKEGKLGGELAMTEEDKRQIIKVEESSTKITIFFPSQMGDMTIELEKVDNDNLKGTLMGYETKAKRGN